ncbi:LPS export ABC transporter periplasmic protein LptC [Limobrevibacterium gyesilva]|uniref:LPS export ABC transporter periplasmic protein LptC n=1 Tax=Limobrevibacterium gyesilva TaxID=2991712 RepID=A0AA41YQM8_9PROT|nr:LPS export ABC transporter periplasmic protein LptC [Limobrevibacterium gyesilva]MCW3474848.1 LPS export ABC transporter periplasmic protein LptC [Limobrevibacterium gyesilva]
MAAPIQPSRRGDGGRLLGGHVRPPPTAGAIARRRWVVGLTKRVLPLVALALLVVVAVWPELTREVDQARLFYGRGTMPDSGQLTQARYHGEDNRHQPYTITAATARQVGQDRVDMTLPKGDISLDSGSWLMVEASTGVYMQKAGQLDLAGEVTMYRDDGTTLRTDAVTIDTHDGAAASADKTHVEGPFGTLDAQGFTMTDRGAVVHFTGPGRLVLNGRKQ